MGYDEYIYKGASDRALGLLNSAYGYVGVALTGTATEIYTFREDSATGSIVRVIEVEYTASNKKTLLRAERTA